jgi:hypothetical protein
VTAELFAERVLRRLAEARDAAATPVIGGAMPDFAAYRHQCGVIQGLSRAIAAIRQELRQLSLPEAPPSGGADRSRS